MEVLQGMYGQVTIAGQVHLSQEMVVLTQPTPLTQVLAVQGSDGQVIGVFKHPTVDEQLSAVQGSKSLQSTSATPHPVVVLQK